MTDTPSLFLVAGPTASGKSYFAQELALENSGEILNADSQQFYKHLDIGTGKLSTKERRVRHWLLDLCEPGSLMTAMEFARQAEGIIDRLFQEGKTPIIVGGTGLYIRALLEGLDPLPDRDPEIRQSLCEELKEKGGGALHTRLEEVDPTSAAKISPNDPSRLVRYLEIYTITGKPPSELMRRGRPSQLRFKVKSFFLNPNRQELRERIERRVQGMIAAGWVREVRSLMENGFNPYDWESKPIGYREIAEVLSGKTTLGEATEEIIKKTQHYAKRQVTFFRGLFENPAFRENGSTLKVIHDFSWEG